MSEINCAVDCKHLCQMSSHGVCDKPRRMSADQIAAELRKHESMGTDGLAEIMMALSSLVNRTPLFEGSEIAARMDEIADDMDEVDYWQSIPNEEF